MSSSQLTNSHLFQRGRSTNHQPHIPTICWDKPRESGTWSLPFWSSIHGMTIQISCLEARRRPCCPPRRQWQSLAEFTHFFPQSFQGLVAPTTLKKLMVMFLNTFSLSTQEPFLDHYQAGCWNVGYTIHDPFTGRKDDEPSNFGLVYHPIFRHSISSNPICLRAKPQLLLINNSFRWENMTYCWVNG